MMRPYAHLSGPVERNVRMMVGFVNLIEKWRALGRALGADTVTLRAIVIEEAFALHEIAWRLGRIGRRRGKDAEQENHQRLQEHLHLPLSDSAGFGPISAASQKRYRIEGF